MGLRRLVAEDSVCRSTAQASIVADTKAYDCSEYAGEVDHELSDYVPSQMARCVQTGMRMSQLSPGNGHTKPVAVLVDIRHSSIIPAYNSGCPVAPARRAG